MAPLSHHSTVCLRNWNASSNNWPYLIHSWSRHAVPRLLWCMLFCCHGNSTAHSDWPIQNLQQQSISDGRFPYSKSKIEIFPRIEKNRNLDFITSLCINFYWRGIHLYSIVITWRHVGKPKIVAVINNPILRASLQIRQLLRGRTTQGIKQQSRSITRHARVPCDPRYGRGWRGGRRETVTWYQPPRDTKTAGAVLGLGHQWQMTPLHQQEVTTTVNCQSLCRSCKSACL